MSSPDVYNFRVLDAGTKSFVVSAQGKRVGNDTRTVIREPPEFKQHVSRSRYTFCIPMATKLEEIVAAARRRVAAAKATADVRALEMRAERHQPREFRRAIQERAASGVAIIAELKKASPSKGVIRQDFPVAELARDLEQAGAVALSVLTDENYFQGSLQNLATASEATRLPCLRKDFIVDELQIVEARATGADAILLIVAALSHAELISLAASARANHLDVLCEVHDSAELRRALDAGFETIGVNNRDLQTFRVDLNTSLQLVKDIPPGVVKVAESGIESAEDIARLRQAGFDAFLIGESLMRAANPGNELRGLLGHAVSAR
jgi:indole-3-glycerol phosphate synthase